MTREKEIEKEAYRQEDLVNMDAEIFIEGAKWADTHPKSHWISVNEKLPPEEEDGLSIKVLVTSNKWNIHLSRYDYKMGGWISPILDIIFTHWMPIPEPTKKIGDKIMTREQAKELLPIIQAFADGKTIQVWYNDTWQDEEYPSFVELNLFRIKPEPKYRSFKNQEECWNEMMKHQPFGWIRESNTKILYNISMIDDCYLSTQDQSKHLVDTLNIYEFLDGTPFGIKEE